MTVKQVVSMIGFALVLVIGLMYGTPMLQSKNIAPRQVEGHKSILPAIKIGKDSAPVKVKMHFSLDCNHCAKFESEVLPIIKKNYIDSGRVQFELIDFPLTYLAVQAAKIAWCDKGKSYRKRVAKILSCQDEWLPYTETPVKVVEANLIKSLAARGISKAECEKCLQNQIIENALVDRRNYAIDELKFDYAPVILINGEAYEGGLNYKEISKELDFALSSKDMR